MSSELWLSLGRWLDRKVTRARGIGEMLYEQPLGRNGEHRARIECNGESLVVGSSLAGQTFAPGAKVPIGILPESGSRFILASPAPGQGGVSTTGQFYPAPVRLPSRNTCPTSAQNRQHLGLYADELNSELHVWNYLDGAFQSVLFVTSLPSGLAVSASDLLTTLTRVDTNRVVLQGRHSGSDALVLWNVGSSGALTYFDTGLDGLLGPVAWGSGLYAVEPDVRLSPESNYLRLYSFTPALTDFAELGMPLEDADHRYSWSQVFVTGADGILVEGWDLDTPEGSAFEDVIARNSGAGWFLEDRDTANFEGLGTAAVGALAGTRGVRYHPAASGGPSDGPGSLTLIGESPFEQAYWPPAWNLAPIAAGTSYSTATSEVVVYPLRTRTDPSDRAAYIRLGLTSRMSTPSTCGAPLVDVEPGPNGQPPHALIART